MMRLTELLFHRFAMRSIRGALAAGLVAGSVLFAPIAHAQVVNYSITGSFTGNNSGDLVLQNAIAPVLGTNTFTLLLSVDASATGTPFFSGGTLYRPISNLSMNVAGFAATTEGCTSTSDFICTVQVRNGTGLSGTGEDRYFIFSDIGRSAAFNTAVGESRTLEFQFILGLFDFTGALLSDESVGLDLTQQSPTAFFGSLAVFAAGQNGFDRADFGVQLSPITLQHAVPEPSTYGLLAFGLAAITLLTGRRRARNANENS